MSIPAFLDGSWDWEIAVEFKGQGEYPDVVHASGMQPDIVLHSPLMKRVMLLEVMVPWESRIEWQHVFKLAKYEELAAGLRRDESPPDSSH